MIAKFLTGLDSKIKWDIFWVAIIQIANYLFPFLTTTYLIRTIGIDLYGMTEFATLFVLYFVTITNYEFHTSATRSISRMRDQPDKIAELTNSVLSTKLFLFVLSTCLFAALLLIWNERFGNMLFIYSYLIVLGHLLYQPYIFQGLGKIRTVALLNFFIKLISMVLIFIVVRSPEDYEIVNLNHSLSFLIVGIISLVIAQKYLGTRFSLRNFHSIRQRLKEGAYIFLTGGLIAQVTINLSGLLLGLYLHPSIIGSYAAAFKIVIALHVVAQLPLKQVFYPILAHAWVHDRAAYLGKFRSYTFLLCAGNLLLGAILLIAAPFIIRVVYGDYYADMIFTLKMLSFLPFLVSLSNAYINDGLIVMGKDKLVFMLLLGVAAANIVLLLIFVPIYGLTAALIIRIFIDVITFLTGIFLYYKALREQK